MMPISELRLIKNALEFQPIENIPLVPGRTRGIYVLYQMSAENNRIYNVVYIGMARGKKTGIRGRLMNHSKQKRDLWSHFSAFEVWDNIREDEIEELEGLFRHLFRFDATANRLNKQKGYKKLGRVRKATKMRWK
jgi:hypothetical protein